MKVIKRNGMFTDFDENKIYNAIKNAYQNVYCFDEQALYICRSVTKQVILDIVEIGRASCRERV